jgi:hypothetical protein
VPAHGAAELSWAFWVEVGADDFVNDSDEEDKQGKCRRSRIAQGNSPIAIEH